jgi:hypothetical protein
MAAAAMERFALFASLRLCVFALKESTGTAAVIGPDGAGGATTRRL